SSASEPGFPSPDGASSTLEAVARYEALVRTLAARLDEPWAADELARARAELGVTQATSDRILAKVRPPPAPPEVAVRQTTLRLASTVERPLVGLVVAVSITGPPPLEAAAAAPLGPGDDLALSVPLRPGTAGHHQLSIAVRGRTLRGEAFQVATDEVVVAIGAP